MNRNGPTGTIPMRFMREIAAFTIEGDTRSSGVVIQPQPRDPWNGGGL